jgi:hypothetical protein
MEDISDNQDLSLFELPLITVLAVQERIDTLDDEERRLLAVIEQELI